MSWWKTRLYEEGLLTEFRRDGEQDDTGEALPIETLGVTWA